MSSESYAASVLRGEDAAFVRNIERRRAVGVRFGEDNFAFGDDAVDMEDAAGNELLEQIVAIACRRVDRATARDRSACGFSSCRCPRLASAA